MGGTLDCKHFLIVGFLLMIPLYIGTSSGYYVTSKQRPKYYVHSGNPIVYRHHGNDISGSNGRNLLRSSDDEEEPDVDPRCRRLPPYVPPTDDLADRTLWEVLDKTEAQLRISEAHTDVILLLGNSGTGKTTLAQLIAGNASSLEVAAAQDGTILIVDPEEKIGQSTASRTLIPELVFSEENKLAIYDCPGFSDNRGATTDIAINFLLKKVIDKVTSVKLVFVVIYSAVMGTTDKLNFGQLATSAAQMIQNLKKLDPAIGLIVTKVPNADPMSGGPISDKKVLTSTRAFLNMFKSDQLKQFNLLPPSKDRDLIQHKMDFVDILLKDDRIALMRYPRECGVLVDSPGVLKNKAQLIDLLQNKVTFAPSTPSDYGYALTDSSYLLIKTSMETLTKNFTDLSSALVDKLNSTVVQKTRLMRNYLDVKGYLQGEFKSFDKTLKQLASDSAIGSEPSEIGKAIQDTITDPGYNDQIGWEYWTTMSKLGDYLTFFEAMSNVSTSERKPQIWLQPFTTWIEEIGQRRDWYDFLFRLETQMGNYDFQGSKPVTPIPFEVDLEFLDRIHPQAGIDGRIRSIFSSHVLQIQDKVFLREVVAQAMALPEITTTESAGCTVSGAYIKASHFVKPDGSYVYSCHDSNIVHVSATVKFFMDHEISPNHKKIQQLFINAPTWEVVTPSTVTINLDGAPGEPPVPAKQVARGLGAGSGIPGVPGNPGYSGGGFFGQFKTQIVHLERLQITANGGKGGQGGTGGDGGEGMKGRTISHSEWPSCWNKGGYFDSTVGGNTLFEDWVTKKGQFGDRGGYGGVGGMGGIGGLGGIVKITGPMGNQLESLGTFTSVLDGPQGDAGQGGEGGIGGQRGDGFAGVYWGTCCDCGYNNYHFSPTDGTRADKGYTGQAGVNKEGRTNPDIQPFPKEEPARVLRNELANSLRSRLGLHGFMNKASRPTWFDLE